MQTVYGDSHYKAFLTLERVQEIRTLWSSGSWAADLSRDFKISRAHLLGILSFRIWKQDPKTYPARTAPINPVKPMPVKSTRVPVAPLTFEQVTDIRKAAATGELHTSIAQKMGRSQPTITRIVNGQRYAQFG